MQTNYAELIEQACQQVDRNERHNCATSRECRIMTGCVKCAPVLRGEIGVEHVSIFPGEDGIGVLRITTTERHDGTPCVVSVKVPLTVHPRRSR